MKTSKENILNNYLKPSQQLIQDITKIKGDILILGAGGKMGPAMAKLAKEAINKTGENKKVIAVSRFSNKKVVKELTNAGVVVIKADLLNQENLDSLPNVANIIYLAGHKFGTSGN